VQILPSREALHRRQHLLRADLEYHPQRQYDHPQNPRHEQRQTEKQRTQGDIRQHTGRIEPVLQGDAQQRREIEGDG